VATWGIMLLSGHLWSSEPSAQQASRNAQESPGGSGLGVFCFPAGVDRVFVKPGTAEPAVARIPFMMIPAAAGAGLILIMTLIVGQDGV
jgi:hypothetical protein